MYLTYIDNKAKPPLILGDIATQILIFNIMANLINLEVITTKPSSNGGHIIKLQNKAVKTLVTPFGTKKTESQTTYYMKLETPGKVGFKADLDIEQFNVIEREFTPEDAEPGAEPLMLKWLQLK